MADKEEVSFLEWIVKVNEGLTIALVEMKDKRYPREQHIEILKHLYPVYYDGCLPYYKEKKVKETEVEQKGLFSDISSVPGNGHTN